MSRLVAFAGIQGAYAIVNRVEGLYKRTLESHDAATRVGFPHTAYYLPVIYSLLGVKVETLEDMKKPLDIARHLLPAHVQGTNHLPYLGPLLDAGMAALFAFEIREAIRYLENPNFYLAAEESDPDGGRLWLGPAEDAIFRKRGVEFVDGSAPGFAAVVGAAPDPETARSIVEEYRKRSIYVFLSANHNGTTLAEQLLSTGMELGWHTKVVPFGPDISSCIFSLGFANRVAMAFGGVTPGDYKKMLIYNKNRVFAFVNALGEVNAEWAAAAAGVINWGFPTIADTDIPEILPSGICTYEHVVSRVPHDAIVEKSIETRGLKVQVANIDIPCAFGPAYEGERVRAKDLFCQMGGSQKNPCTEYLEMADMTAIEDGRIIVHGPDVPDLAEGAALSLAVFIQVAGREFQKDFEPILERQIHHLVNYIQGVMHIGQRDISWVRVSKAAVEKGFTLKHLGVVLHAKLHQDFGAILDKVQVTLYTRPEDVDALTARARAAYKVRDERVDKMTDESVEVFYSCTLCQSFAPTHVCTVSPERTGLCGAYNWMDCKAAFQINATGPNQPVPKGRCLDPVMGQWEGVNDFVNRASRGAIPFYNFYSLVHAPMTTCGCCECIAVMLPGCNGVMTVNREYTGETPCGMKFTTLAGVMGGGQASPGFVGHSKYNITQRKFIAGDGGLLRMVWMPKSLKEDLRERLLARGAELGMPDFIDRIADETVGSTEEEILPWLRERKHPALEMEPLVG